MNSGFDLALSELVVWSISIVIVMALLAFTIVGGIAFYRTSKGAAKSFSYMFERGNFLRIATVVFVVFAVVLLSAMGALNEGAVAVLSGVAGYVLGGLEKTNDKSLTGDEFDGS